MSINEHPDIKPGPVRLPLVPNRPAPALQRKVQNSKANRTRTVPDKRRFQRVNIPSFGRFMRENKQEHPCQIVDMSAGGIAVHAPTTGEIGERIIIYVDNMGRLEGELVRIFEGGFALKLSASSYKREKIVNQLTWLINKDELKIIEDRRHHRFSPAKTSTRMTMADGTVHDCTILDMSLGGAAISVMPRPDIGQAVILGLTPGKVIRLTDTAVNIQFLEIQDPATLERQFG